MISLPRFAVVVGLAMATVAAEPAAAQNSNRRLVVEGHGGHAGFVDNSTIHHRVAGAAARIFISRRVAVGPEVTYMRGPGADRDWFVTGNATVDLRDASAARRRVVPYLVVGAGATRMTTRVGTGLYSSGEGTFTAGGGARITPSGRWFVAPEVRLGWELHWRMGVSVGLMR